MSLGILPKGISVSWQTQHSTFHLRFALVPSCLLSFISVVSADHQKKKKIITGSIPSICCTFYKGLDQSPFKEKGKLVSLSLS